MEHLWTQILLAAIFRLEIKLFFSQKDTRLSQSLMRYKSSDLHHFLAAVTTSLL